MGTMTSTMKTTTTKTTTPEPTTSTSTMTTLAARVDSTKTSLTAATPLTTNRTRNATLKWFPLAQRKDLHTAFMWSNKHDEESLPSSTFLQRAQWELVGSWLWLLGGILMFVSLMAFLLAIVGRTARS